MYKSIHILLTLGKQQRGLLFLPLQRWLPCDILQSIHALPPISLPVWNQSIDTLRKPVMACCASWILIISIIIELDVIHLTLAKPGSAGAVMPHFTSITT